MNSIFNLATGGNDKIPDDWMPATQVRPFIFEDPAVVWLKYFGNIHNLYPDPPTQYEFLDFIGNKGHQFEEKWIKEIAPEAVCVCNKPYEVRSVEKFQQTYELIQSGSPIIAQPAIWWAPEKIYGVPDLLIRKSWIKNNLPDLSLRIDDIAEDYYLVFDIKFTTNLDSTDKKNDLSNYAAQIRIYTYILGHLQNIMPNLAFLVTRDHIFDPSAINTDMKLNAPLDEDLRKIREQFLEIKLNGNNYVPWKDEIVRSNIFVSDDTWAIAKKKIAEEKIPGKDTGLLYQIGQSAKLRLAELGFQNLDSIINSNPEDVPFESCKGLGASKAKRIRAILEANRSGKVIDPKSDSIPTQKQYEFYVDFEYFTNVNVDFERQWPDLDGCEMIFMIGVGWEEYEKWSFSTFTAEKESHENERIMFDKFIEFLQSKTKDCYTDDDKTAIYHWSNAEVWQSRRFSDRHQFPEDSSVRRLPWNDLQKTFLNSPCVIPEAWDFGLKKVTRALAAINAEYDPHWPGDLDEGLRAMVMGWKAYESDHPNETIEMRTLTQYLEADCRALWNILRWLRGYQ